jgi:hypothetical protein
MACSRQLPETRDRPDDAGVEVPVENVNTSESEPEISEYPGRTIDDVFPVIAAYSLLDETAHEPDMNVEVAGYSETIKNYVPRNLKKDGRIQFNFKKRESGGYWATAVGLSHLRGPHSSEIFTIVSGPGAVCCTNFTIVDISSQKPRSIFHSEDFGTFRSPMEIFDAEDDGVYELVQFDSCFRYFMGDCGSCSPEPRAYFRYDRKRRQYRPTRGIAQKFVKEQMAASDKWIEEKYKEWILTKDPRIQTDLQRAVLAHVIDLLYIGEHQRAWRTFNKYAENKANRVKREIEKTLRSCKFYRQIKP